MFMIHLDDIVCGAYCHALERCEKESADSSKWYEARHLPMKVLDDYATAVRRRLANDTGDAILSLDRDQTWGMIRSNTDIIDYDEWVAHNRIAIRDGVTAEQVAKKLAGGIPTATIRALEHPSCVAIIDGWLDNENKWFAIPTSDSNGDDDGDGGGDDTDIESDAMTSDDRPSNASPEQSYAECDAKFRPVMTHIIDIDGKDDSISIRRDDGGYVVSADSPSRPTVSVTFDDVSAAGNAYMRAMESFVLGGASAFDALAGIIADMSETQD